jgi:hypothetical protein
VTFMKQEKIRVAMIKGVAKILNGYYERKIRLGPYFICRKSLKQPKMLTRYH